MEVDQQGNYSDPANQTDQRSSFCPQKVVYATQSRLRSAGHLEAWKLVAPK